MRPLGRGLGFSGFRLQNSGVSMLTTSDSSGPGWSMRFTVQGLRGVGFMGGEC